MQNPYENIELSDYYYCPKDNELYSGTDDAEDSSSDSHGPSSVVTTLLIVLGVLIVVAMAVLAVWYVIRKRRPLSVEDEDSVVFYTQTQPTSNLIV